MKLSPEAAAKEVVDDAIKGIKCFPCLICPWYGREDKECIFGLKTDNCRVFKVFKEQLSKL